MGCPTRPRGFTLIEAMVVLAIVAIVGALAGPSFRTFIATMQSKSAAFDLINDLALARSEAIKRNEQITIRPVDDDGNWSKGWVVIREADDVDVDTDDPFIRVREGLGSSLVVAGAPNSMTFLPNGRPGDDTVDDNMSWSISTSAIQGVTPRCVIITPTGTARSKSGGC